MEEPRYVPRTRHIETRRTATGWVGLIVADYSRGYGYADEERVEHRTGEFPEEEDARAAAERAKLLQRKR